MLQVLHTITITISSLYTYIHNILNRTRKYVRVYNNNTPSFWLRPFHYVCTMRIIAFDTTIRHEKSITLHVDCIVHNGEEDTILSTAEIEIQYIDTRCSTFICSRIRIFLNDTKEIYLFNMLHDHLLIVDHLQFRIRTMKTIFTTAEDLFLFIQRTARITF